MLSESDWTPAAFLASLGLDTAADEATRAALKERLLRLLDADIGELRRLGRLDAVKVRNLGSDWPSAILTWMERPNEKGEDWESLCSELKGRYSVDPTTDGELVAAEHLAQANGIRSAVWSRFADAPHKYSSTVELLRRAEPPGILDRDDGCPAKNKE